MRHRRFQRINVTHWWRIFVEEYMIGRDKVCNACYSMIVGCSHNNVIIIWLLKYLIAIASKKLVKTETKTKKVGKGGGNGKGIIRLVKKRTGKALFNDILPWVYAIRWRQSFSERNTAATVIPYYCSCCILYTKLSVYYSKSKNRHSELTKHQRVKTSYSRLN